jgi:signal transduction histidine kinase
MDIRFDDACLHLRVADDGQGFDPTQPSDGSHYGLLSMRERAADAGGRCTIESTPGRGVEVVAEFPLTGT